MQVASLEGACSEELQRHPAAWPSNCDECVLWSWGREARLYVCGNGQGSPCLDLRRVPEALADATVGTDLVVIEGMGRAIHTNYRRAAMPAVLNSSCL